MHIGYAKDKYIYIYILPFSEIISESKTHFLGFLLIWEFTLKLKKYFHNINDSNFVNIFFTKLKNFYRLKNKL